MTGLKSSFPVANKVLSIAVAIIAPVISILSEFLSSGDFGKSFAFWPTSLYLP